MHTAIGDVHGIKVEAIMLPVPVQDDPARVGVRRLPERLRGEAPQQPWLAEALRSKGRALLCRLILLLRP